MRNLLHLGLSLIPLRGMGEITYRLLWAEEPPYTYRVIMRLSPSKGPYTDLRMPSWRPGRYILQNYAGALYHFSAQTPDGQPLAWKKIRQRHVADLPHRKGLYAGSFLPHRCQNPGRRLQLPGWRAHLLQSYHAFPVSRGAAE